MTTPAVYRSVLPVLLSFLLTSASLAAQGPASGLPPGWQLDGPDLVWTSEAPLRAGGARYEFRSGTRLLGYPATHGRTLRLRLSPPGSLTDLSVWAAGRRLDAAAHSGVTRLRMPQAAPPDDAPLAASTYEPAARGPYPTERLRYALPDLPVAGFEAPVEVVGEVVAPLGTAGPLPLVVFLHGRHNTCYRGGPDGESVLNWPCPPGWRPVPSHSGYRYMTRVLASQGYLTVSIAANGVNGQDGLFLDGGAFARSALLRHHLARWAKWSRHGGDPWGGRFHGRVDLDRVVMVGHSRGGEGVERAAIDSDADDPWTIRGLMLIGPTAFGRQVAPGIATTVILPFCDGDVSDLQGQQYVDIGRDLTIDRALRSSVMAMGTNHNYYNSEWTPGLSQSPAWDDWFDPNDPQCGEGGPQRLSPREQQAVGLAYTAALVDLAVQGNPRALPLLDGARVKPASIGRARAFVHAVGGDKRVLYAAGRGLDFSATGLTASQCRGFFNAGPFDLRPGCGRPHYFEVLPHWTPMAFGETAPAPKALRVQWSAPGGRLEIPVEPGSRAFDGLDFRIAGEPDAAPVEIDVRVRDAAGRWTRLGTQPLTLRSYHGPSPLGKVVARQLRASLAGSRVDPTAIRAVELSPRSAEGRFWLLDISSWRDRVADSDPIRLPRVSVGDVIVREGDSGEHSVDVPVFVDGAVTRPAYLWVQLTDYSSFEDPTRGFPLVLEPGATSAFIPFEYIADDVYTPFPQQIQVVLQARRNAVTADFDATLFVEEDDPAPVLTVDAAEVTAAEGAALTWTFRLSEPLVHGGYWFLQFLPADARFPELDSDDVPADFLEWHGIVPPDEPVVLSELGIFLSLEFPPGETQASVSVPIARDGVAEPAEGVVLLLDGVGDPVVPVPIEVSGSVD
ncbi:MAG TPA: hypothetical protein VFY03_11395 [Woeseiaceae bacterium]|nr:hypothetical protein [Woeseiaceae bacterium]